jgi:tight adherence protein B
LISALFLIFFNKSKPIDKLKFLDEDNDLNEKYENQKKTKVSILKSLSNLVPHSRLNKKRGLKLETDLMKADLPITVEELLV